LRPPTCPPIPNPAETSKSIHRISHINRWGLGHRFSCRVTSLLIDLDRLNAVGPTVSTKPITATAKGQA
jgi:hypothetical protein